MWDINDARYGTPEKRDRAMIVPTGTSVNLGAAASAWRRILTDMTVYTPRDNVQQAVDDANAALKSAGSTLQFAVYGNAALHF